MTDLVVDLRAPGGTVRAVDIPTLTVPAATSMAIMGPSGCGKSTLLGVLAGLALPTAGTVAIGPTTLSALSDVERVAFRRRGMGLVHQADNLLPFLTVGENLRLRAAIAATTLTDDELDRLLERLGLDGLGERLPDQLSGGQRQRAAVARAVVHRPEVILADEPTGALDARNAGAVAALLREVAADVAATLVLVTHDRQVADGMDLVVGLRDGSVVGDDEVHDAD